MRERYDDAEQIEAGLAEAEEQANKVNMIDGAHHFMLAEPIGRDEIKPPVTVVFDQPTPQFSDVGNSLPAAEKEYDDEARRFADLMRKTMPQGLRDRVAIHLMGDLMSLLCLSQDDVAERDNRQRYVPNFRPIRQDMVFLQGQELTVVLTEEGEVQVSTEEGQCGNCDDCSCGKKDDLFKGTRVEFDD